MIQSQRRGWPARDSDSSWILAPCMVEKRGTAQWIEDLGGESVASLATAILAVLFTVPVIDHIVSSRPDAVSWKFAIMAVCVASYLESVILLAKATRREESAQKRFLMKSLNGYFAGIGTGEFCELLLVRRPELGNELLILLLLLAIAGTLVLVLINRRGSSS